MKPQYSCTSRIGALCTFVSAVVCLLLSNVLRAQTTLQRGDILVLAVNSNNRACSSTASADDLVSFICFKDIQPNTQIDLTDNGWERLLAGSWGNSEGFVSAIRTGAVIPAGTVITFLFPPIGNQPYQAIAPDTQWTFTQKSPNNLNLNTGGDQLYLMHGGLWNQHSLGLNFNHDATYTGGNMLFGFNTKTSWTPFLNSSQESGLHPETARCYHTESNTTANDYISYAGSFAPATQLEWIARVNNPANWKSYPDCAAMPKMPARIDPVPSGIQLQCQTCRACTAYTETLTFLLPTQGGPFDVSYTDGTDTFQVSGIHNGATQTYPATTSVTLQLLSVTDAAGCPVYSNLGSPIAIRITDHNQPVSVPPLQVCGISGTAVAFNLTTRDTFFTQSNPDFRVNWYRDSILKNPISQPTQFTSISGVVYALASNGICSIGPVQVLLEVLETPTATLPLGGRLCTGEPCLPMPFSLTGKAPFLLQYDLERPGFATIPGEKVLPDTNTIWEICPDSLGVAQGDILFRYQTLTDANGCSVDVSKQIAVLRRGQNGTHRVQPVLCPGRTFQFMGNTYDAQNPVDTIILQNATASGCDSLILIELQFTDSLAVDLIGDTSICAGAMLRLNWKLRGGVLFDIIYQEGTPQEGVPNKMLSGVKNGDPFDLWLTQNTTLQILNVQARESGCATQPRILRPIQVNTLQLTAQQVARFGGNAVSCTGASDGKAAALIRGGRPPYHITWSNGDTTLQASQLKAGTYHVAVTDQEGCRQNAAVQVKEPGPLRPILEINPARCPELPSRVIIQRIAGGVPPYQYALDGQLFTLIDKFPTAIPDLPSGSYTFTLLDANLCENQTPFELQEPNALEVDLGPDRNIRAGDSITLIATSNFSPTHIYWFPDQPDHRITGLTLSARPTTTTIYRIELADTQGCKTKDEVTVRVDRDQSPVYAPNAFSPNGDGNNDLFQIFPGPEVQDISVFRIFNRWGALMFETSYSTNAPDIASWDGMFGNEPAPVGTYMFLVELKLPNGESQHISGSFMLIR